MPTVVCVPTAKENEVMIAPVIDNNTVTCASMVSSQDLTDFFKLNLWEVNYLYFPLFYQISVWNMSHWSQPYYSIWDKNEEPSLKNTCM